MGRKPRFEYPGGVYHIIQRGNNREYIFENNEENKFIIGLLKEYGEKFGFDLYSYVIMSNHYHLIIKLSDVPLQDIMHRINNKFSRDFNKKYKRTGHVFENRYKSILVIDDKYLLSLLRYVHQNPVIAHMCKNEYILRPSKIFQDIELSRVVEYKELEECEDDIFVFRNLDGDGMSYIINSNEVDVDSVLEDFTAYEDYIYDYIDGKIIFNVENKTEILDEASNEVATIPYDEFGDYRDGEFIIKVNNKWGVVKPVSLGGIGSHDSKNDDSNELSESSNNVTEEEYDYIIPGSNQRELTDDDLKDLSAEELALGRNEIFARHGYIFETEEYNQYFSSQSWYQQNLDFNESYLSETESYNVTFIKEYENQLTDTKPEESNISPNRMDDYNLELFIDNLRENLMSSNLKDIYTEKSREEKMAISEFLRSFRYFHYDTYDISNLDQSVIANFIGSLLLRNYDIIEPVEQDSIEHRYNADGATFNREFREEDVNKLVMETFGINIDFQKYSPDNYEGGYVFIGEAYDPEPLTSVKISNVFPMKNDLLYIQFDLLSSWSFEDRDIVSNSLYEELPLDIKQYFQQDQINHGHAIIRERINNGRKTYQLIMYNSNANGEYLIEEKLNQYVSKINPDPNISFNYNKTKDFTEASEYKKYLKEIIAGLNGEMPNDRANGEIVTYIQHAVENSSTIEANSNKNRIIIDPNIIAQASKSAEETKLDLYKILQNNNIVLNKNADIVLRISSLDLDLDKAISIVFDTSTIEALGTSDGIRVVLGDNQHTVYINSEDLKGLINEIGNISVNIQKGKDTYIIVFMDGKGLEIDQLPFPISFSLPADNELATIFANYKGGSDNWGGQYSSATNSI